MPEFSTNPRWTPDTSCFSFARRDLLKSRGVTTIIATLRLETKTVDRGMTTCRQPYQDREQQQMGTLRKTYLIILYLRSLSQSRLSGEYSKAAGQAQQVLTACTKPASKRMKLLKSKLATQTFLALLWSVLTHDRVQKDFRDFNYSSLFEQVQLKTGVDLKQKGNLSGKIKLRLAVSIRTSILNLLNLNIN